MPISRAEANALAELVCTVRPQWNTRGVIVKGLAPLAKHPAPLEVIAWAALRAAADREILTPAVIPLNGPHWNLADRPPEPRLTPEYECKKHPGQWADWCSSCHADLKADPTVDDHLEPVDGRDARSRARAAARAAKHALTIDNAEPDTDDVPSDSMKTPTGQDTP